MSRQRALPIDAWPLPDRLGWQAATTAGASLLDDGGLAAHLSPRSRDDLQRRYAYFLDWADRHGRLVKAGGPAATITPDTVTAYIADVKEHLSSVTVAYTIGKLHRMASLLAPPASNWGWLNRLSVRLARQMKPADKRHRIVESGELYQYGLQLMAEAEAALAEPRRSQNRPARRAPSAPQPPSFQMACRHRDGLMIALLAACPVRRGNLADLDTRQTLVHRPGGWSIEISGACVKNRRPIAMPIPDALAPHLDRHLAVFRPVFGGETGGDCLWLSRLGQPLSDSAIYNAIVTRTKAGLGKGVGPHLFRDALVTTIAIHHGSHIRAASAALGHVDEKTTTRHYNSARMISAVRYLQEAALRHGLANPGPGDLAKD
jgi:integrase